MTITLATVYTPIAFQGGLTGSLFLEFAITLAAAVVVSGFVALTLSPVMSSKCVHEHGEEARLTKLVNRGFDAVSRTLRAIARRRVQHALGHRGRGGARHDLAAWPLYHVLAPGAGAGRGSEPHQPVLRGAPRTRRCGRDDPTRSKS